MALRLGAGWSPDTAGDLNEALRRVLCKAGAKGWAATLYIAADLPLLTSEAIDGMIALAGERQVGIAPDRWGRGRRG